MKILRLLPILTIYLFMSIQAYAEGPEITVYETYDDFVAKKGTDYDRYKGYSYALSNVTLILEHHSEKVKVKCSQIWGFRYKDAIFRVDKRYNQPAKLISYGQMCYYENGLAHLSMMRDRSQSASFSLGAYCYVSLDLKDELYQFSGKKGDAKKARAHFEERNPMYGSYFECVGHTNSVEVHRTCIAAFQEAHPLED